MIELSTGLDMLDSAFDENGKISHESMLEDAVKFAFFNAVNCQLSKFYTTDGFGPYYGDNNVMFVLNESKIVKNNSLEITFKRALIQAIAYYLNIKSGKYNIFSKTVVNLAYEYEYVDVQQFVLDHFGCFVLTCSDRIMVVPLDTIKDLVSLVEIKLDTNLSPSKIWDCDSEIRKIVEDYDLSNLESYLLNHDFKLSEIKNVFNEIIDKWN